MLTQLAFFHDPVDTVVVFDYLSVCPKPMDFSSILHTRAAPPHTPSRHYDCTPLGAAGRPLRIILVGKRRRGTILCVPLDDDVAPPPPPPALPLTSRHAPHPLRGRQRRGLR